MSTLERIERQLKEEIARAVIEAGVTTKEHMPDIMIETPNEKSHGDYATNIAMQLTRIAKKAPRDIATKIVEALRYEETAIEKVEIAGPGFINIFIEPTTLHRVIPEVFQKGKRYGETNRGNGKRVQVEFVSANPTGSLHLGHARGAAIGDSLCNILEKAGYAVEREYYINDAGNQIHNLVLSLEARYYEELGHKKEMPEDGYFGQDMVDIAKTLVAEKGDSLLHMEEQERHLLLRKYGLQKMLDRIEADLQMYRVKFDHWFSETSLYEKGKVEEVVAYLRETGEAYEKDGATWFRSTAYGDDKDRVLIKKDGTYTYLTPDIAYHRNKMERGFEMLVNIWGADHHGYIPRMKAAMEALGYKKEQLHVQIIQMVSLFQGGERVRMSKRTGKAVTLRELMEEVGVDAMRYFFVMRSPDSHLDFDMDLAVSESNENPVYYAQYAHARICSVLAQGEEAGITFDETTDLTPLTSAHALDLLKAIAQFPLVVSEAAVTQMPHRITNYIQQLAQTLHSYYNAERIIDPADEKASKARLALMKATQRTIKNALHLVGVHAPEKM